MKFFMKKTTISQVLQQLRHKAGYPVYISDIQIEKDLYESLGNSSKIFYGRLRNMRVFRIVIPRRKIVYAVGRPVRVKNEYNIQIMAIKSVRAYNSSEVYMRYNPSWGARQHYRGNNYNIQIR